MKTSLIILSIPLQRLIKTHLSNFFLDALKVNGDVLVIAPFADNENFLKDYQESVSYLVQYENIKFLSAIKSTIFLIIKTLRINGYWLANPLYMGYYLSNQYTKFGNNGNDIRVNYINRKGISALGFIGRRWKNSWKILAKLLPLERSFKNKLLNISSAYQQVIVIQACSWGEQDLDIAILAKKYGWKSILVPYTTDQLLCNGWLYADYSAICVQGPLEKDYAINFHRIPKERLVELGSLNFRKLDLYTVKLENTNINQGKIIYAGSISRYFPIESELEGLETILNAQLQGYIPDFEVIYRSFGEDRAQIEKLRSKYKFTNKLRIDYVSDLFAGLDGYGGAITDDAMNQYIQQLRQASLLVTVGCTSLILDAAFLGVPSVSCWVDKSGIILKRNTRQLFTNDGKLRDLFRHVPAAFTEKELITLINEHIYIELSKNRVIRSIIDEWDFPNIDSYKVLSNTILEIINEYSKLKIK